MAAPGTTGNYQTEGIAPVQLTVDDLARAEARRQTTIHVGIALLILLFFALTYAMLDRYSRVLNLKAQMLDVKEQLFVTQSKLETMQT